ncbi:uncharacterized protein PF3D7_1120000-like [Diabrotica virgifera virgifera]|uniref:Uncharacterized protein n=1 Tax=Diabrotica virgifera virgifera TaxID=50390 RepID=A0ABM5L133_DIAVI|nr:uncharacterized protein PF3D7_1120000-like [Diabrotica virgifera virgifera]
MSNKRDKPKHENSFDEEEVFKRSKSTTRTPPKDNKEEQEKQEMEDIKKMLKEMNEDIKTQIKELKTELKEENEEIRNNIREERKELKQENKMLKAENKKITEDLSDLKRSMERLDKEKRKNNLIISGLIIDSEDPIALKQEMTNMLENHPGRIKTDVKRAQKIGTETCLVELGNEEEKVAILRNKSKLKKVKHRKICITEDLTKRDQQKAKALRDISREMREKVKIL